MSGRRGDSRLPAEQTLALLLDASIAMTSLLARLQSEIAGEHSGEIKRSACSSEQRRAAIVHRLLAGASPGAGELAELGYDLDGWHLAVIATGVRPRHTVERLAAGLGCELLVVARGDQTVWAWLGSQRRLAFADVQRVGSRQLPASVSLAVGEPGRGIGGWRVTNREAQAAWLVAREAPRKLTRYLDVPLEAGVLHDEALADSLIEGYLSCLDDSRGGGVMRRRMLRAFFAAEHNKSSAAHALGVDRVTVHRQLKEIERRLGCRVHERQPEIEVALRVEDLRGRRSVGAVVCE